jgi:hypothetical protein
LHAACSMDNRLSAYALRALPIRAGAWEEDTCAALSPLVVRGERGHLRRRHQWTVLHTSRSQLKENRAAREERHPAMPASSIIIL